MTAEELWNKLKESSTDRPLSPEEYARVTGLEKPLIEKIYRRWVEMGRLDMFLNEYYFTDNEPVEEEQKPEELQEPVEEPEVAEEQSEETVQEPEVKEPPKVKPKKTYKPRKPKEPEKKYPLKYLMKIIVFGIGTILMITSVHFTYGFNKLGMTKLWAILLSVSIVSFMCFAFTIRSYMKGKFARTAVIILWSLGLLYSVFTAVSGQYNSFRKYNETDTSSTDNERKELVTERLSELQARYDEISYLRGLEKDYTLNPDLKVENPQTWALIKSGVAELKELETKISELQDTRYTLVDNSTVLNTTVYHWLGETTGIDSDVIQLIIILFPALFMDLCSTLCLSFALAKED